MARINTFAGRIRKAVTILADRQPTFTITEIANEAHLKSRKDMKKMQDTMQDLLRAGEVAREERGIYRKTDLGERPRKAPSIQDKMWWVLRVRSEVAIEDLQELAGASKEYAKEYLRLLVRREMVRKKKNGMYTLINDPGAMPTNDEKAKKLRQLRARKKKALAALDNAGKVLAEARAAVMKIDDSEE